MRRVQAPLSLLALVTALYLAAALAHEQLPEAEYLPQSGLATLPPLPLGDVADGHCDLVAGAWCGKYYNQVPEAWRPAPRGNLDCPDDCGGLGSCNHDTGVCACPSGWGGPSCMDPRKRPCDNMGPDRRDRSPGTAALVENVTNSRCAGLCDDDIGFCYCPPGSKHGQVAAPGLSPLGAPPKRSGRPLFRCSAQAPASSAGWTARTHDELFSKGAGWCSADLPQKACPCVLDGLAGGLCNVRLEHFCLNQCSGHGVCRLGFCKCHPGWYPGGGGDCSRRRARMDVEPDDVRAGVRPWLGAALTPVTAAATDEGGIPVPAARLRPLIYVYELPTTFTSDLLQWRIQAECCTYRLFGLANATKFVPNARYPSESALLELLLTTSHRTFDPEEADFFYVPALSACLDQLLDDTGTDVPSPGHNGPLPAAEFLVEAHKWVYQAFPYFNRTRGRDHIWLMAQDGGACDAPPVIWPGIMLTHWGDTGAVPQPALAASGQTALATAATPHACFDPHKDLVLPVFQRPSEYQHSPYLGHRPKRRDIFLFYRGDAARGSSACVHGRCTARAVSQLYRDKRWHKQYGALIGTTHDIPGDKSDLLSRSVFCLVLSGDGQTSGFPDAVLHGCIPVLVLDGVHVPFEKQLNVSQFTVRIAEADMAQLPTILRTLPPSRVEGLQAALHRTWHRFRYAGLTLTQSHLRRLYEANRDDAGGSAAPHPPGSQWAASEVDDAFSMLLQWLIVRVPYTRGD